MLPSHRHHRIVFDVSAREICAEIQWNLGYVKLCTAYIFVEYVQAW